MTQKVILLLSGVNEKKASRLVQTNGWKLAYTQSECSQDKTPCVKACAGFKTATDTANKSKECLSSLTGSEEEKPQRVNLLSVNEYFSGKSNNRRAFLVSLLLLKELGCIEQANFCCSSWKLFHRKRSPGLLHF